MEDIKELYEFMRKMDSKLNHVSNVYVAKTYTVDGELTDTKYGMNLLTDYGFSQFFANDTDVSFPTTLFVGEGTQSFDKTSSNMTAVLWNGTSAKVDNSTVSHDYPLYYSPGETDSDGRITTVSRYLVCHYNANIDGVSSNVTITEYGIGSTYNQLWTHSFVYDNQGYRTTLLKKPNEILEITVYFCCTYLESLIMDNFANNIYSIITTGNIMMNRMKIPTVGTYKRANHSNTNGYKARSATYSRSAVVDSTVTKTALMEDVLVTPYNTEYEKYIDGFYATAVGTLIVQPQRLTTPISFEIGPISTYNVEEYYGYSEKFGVEFPLTQLTVTDVKLFNPFAGTSGEWSNVGVYYYNDPRHDLDDTMMTVAFRTSMYYTNNNNTEQLFVFLNQNPTDPIVKIRGNIEMIYATDKYWKGPNIPNNDWIRIVDRDNIPLEAQHKRFWITNSSSINLQPLRGYKDFYLKLSNDTDDSGYRTLPYGLADKSIFSCPTCSIFNTEYHWSFVWGGYDRSYYNATSEIFGFDVGFYRNMNMTKIFFAATYGRWLFVVSDITINIWDTSDIPNGNLGSPTQIAYSSSGYVYGSETTEGIMFTCQPTRGTGTIYDLRVNPVTTTNFPCKCGCCMYRTNKIAYITSDSSTLKIYDVDTGLDELSITIPTLDGTANFIFAHINHVWITTSNSKMYVCKLSTGEFTICDKNFSGYNLGGMRVECFDNIVTLRQAEGTNGWITGTNVNDDPTHFVTGNDLSFGGYTGDNMQMFTVQPFRVGNSLVGIAVQVSTHWSDNGRPMLCYVDLGRMICTGEIIYINGLNTFGLTFAYDKWFMHGDKMIPMINMLPIKVAGTTTTISSIDNVERNVSGKRFDITYSNKTIFNGKPPGTKN